MRMRQGFSEATLSRRNSDQEEIAARIYVFEPGWRVIIKRGSTREFCHVMSPGQDHYHRLMDGEVFLMLDEQKVCLNCAARRGILSFEPRHLKNPIDPSLADSSELPLFDADSGDLL